MSIYIKSGEKKMRCIYPIIFEIMSRLLTAVSSVATVPVLRFHGNKEDTIIFIL